MYIITIISTIGFLIGLKKYKIFFNPVSVFNFIWCIISIIILCDWNVGIYKPSLISYQIILVGVCGFNIASSLPKTTFLKNKINKYKNENYNKCSLKINVLVVLSAIILIYSLIQAKDSLGTINDRQSFSNIREEYFNVTNSYEYYLQNYIVSPLRYVMIVSSIVQFFFGEKNSANKYLYINTILTVLLQAFLSGGRYILLNSFYMILCATSIKGRNEKLKLKQKTGLIILILVLLQGIIYLTNYRITTFTSSMTMFERVWHTTYTYFTGSVTYMSELIERFTWIKSSTFGVNFMSGYITPIFALLTFLGILSYPKIFNIIGQYACIQLQIGSGIYYNAMPTIFMYFYIDFGIIGVFVEISIFALICKYTYELAINTKNIYRISIFLLIFIQITNVSTKWFFYAPDFCIALFILKFFFEKSFDAYENERVQ